VTRILFCDIDDLPVIVVHIEVDPMFNRSSFEAPLDIEPLEKITTPHLDSTRVALHHSCEESTKALTRTTGAPSQSF
jgi:hypothetical protein